MEFSGVTVRRNRDFWCFMEVYICRSEAMNQCISPLIYSFLLIKAVMLYVLLMWRRTWKDMQIYWYRFLFLCLPGLIYFSICLKFFKVVQNQNKESSGTLVLLIVIFGYLKFRLEFTSLCTKNGNSFVPFFSLFLLFFFFLWCQLLGWIVEEILLLLMNFWLLWACTKYCSLYICSASKFYSFIEKCISFWR